MSPYLDFWGLPWNYPEIVAKTELVYKRGLTKSIK